MEIAGGNFYWNLKGTRKLKKTYSYIPLHFMAEIGKEKGTPFNRNKLEEQKYKMSDDPLLVRVKERLRKYVFGSEQPFRFKPLKQVDEKYKGAKIPEQRYADYLKELQDQKDLRKLRNEYLHWSAKREGFGMDPTSDRKRVVH